LVVCARQRSRVPTELAEHLRQRRGLVSLLAARANELSRGERRWVALFDALCTDRPVLALDERFGGFDPLHLLDILSLVRKRAVAGQTLFLSLHQMSDAEKVAACCLLLRQGHVVALGIVIELQQRASLPGAPWRTPSEPFSQSKRPCWTVNWPSSSGPASPDSLTVSRRNHIMPSVRSARNTAACAPIDWTSDGKSSRWAEVLGASKRSAALQWDWRPD
jgi:ABC-type multidrug transport system ATPase subunit